MIIYMHISIVAIRLATERDTGIVRVMDRICSEVMRSSLEGTTGVDGNLCNVSELSIMHCREGIERRYETGHLIVGRSVGRTSFVGTVGKEASLPFERALSSIGVHTGFVLIFEGVKWIDVLML